jgi:hypothetical protein
VTSYYRAKIFRLVINRCINTLIRAYGKAFIGINTCVAGRERAGAIATEHGAAYKTGFIDE